MKLHGRQRVLLALGILVLAATAGATVHHLRMKRALADYEAQLIAQGERLTVEEMTPKPVPIEQNGASAFLRALTLMNVQQEILTTNPPSGMRMVAPGKAQVGWAQPSIRSPEATNAWEDAIVIVDNLSPALATLEELIEHPNLDFGVDYRLGFAAPLPNLGQTKQAAQKLYYAALCDLHQGDTESATRRLRALLAISHGSADERLVISQLVRIAITAIGAAGTWELLQSPSVTDEQLAQIQKDWTRLEFIQAAANALAMERAMGAMMLDRMRSSSSEFKNQVSSYAPLPSSTPQSGSDVLGQIGQLSKIAWQNTRLKAKETAWRFSWSYTDQLRTLKGDQALLEALRFARTNGDFHAALKLQEELLAPIGIKQRADEDSIGQFGADLDIQNLFSQGVLSLTGLLKRIKNIEASRQLVTTAIALRRYKLAHGNYPVELTALVPELLPAPPRDPADGQTLRYKLNADGAFRLYSVGEDGEDNGGDPTPANPEGKSVQWQRGRDWVWPQPATSLEVEDYYRREFKQPLN